MKNKKIILSVCLGLLVFSFAGGTAYAHGRIIVRPWWPWPAVVFPFVPPPPEIIVAPPPILVPPPPPGPVPLPPPAVIRQSGFIDLDIRPQSAKVFTDDEYRGIADNFDGVPSYLELPGGRHRITFKKEGYTTVSFIVKIVPGETITLELALDPLTKESRLPEERVYQLEAEKTGPVEFDVFPPDAAIYIDGAFYGTASQFRSPADTILLSTGPHRIEIIKPGFKDITDDITVVENQKVRLKVELKRKE